MIFSFHFFLSWSWRLSWDNNCFIINIIDHPNSTWILIKFYIATNNDFLCFENIDSITFWLRNIAKKNTFLYVVTNLIFPPFWDANIIDTTKHFEMFCKGIFVCSIPQLASSFEPPLLDTCITHKLLYNQNLFERPLSFSIALSISITIQFLFIYLFFPFRYVILFRSINNFQLMFYTFTFIEISKLCRVVTCIQYYDFSLNFYFTTSTLILNIIFEFF